MALISGGGGAPSGAAGGDLGGTYPNPTVDLNTAGGTLNGATSIIPAAATAGLTITHPSADSTKILDLTGVHTGFTLDCDGTLDYNSDDVPNLTVRGIGTRAGFAVNGEGAGQQKYSIGTSAKAGIVANDANTLALAFRLCEAFFKFKFNVAPADADLSANECAIWFDPTNGVGNTKLMVKGKSADGTVKTASIVLA